MKTYKQNKVYKNDDSKIGKNTLNELKENHPFWNEDRREDEEKIVREKKIKAISSSRKGVIK